MSSLRKLFILTKPYWPRVLGAIITGGLASGVIGGIAWVVKPALDVIFVDKKYDYLTYIPFGIVILFVFKGLLQYWQAYLMNSAGLKLVRDTQNRLHNHILFMPIGYFSRQSSGVVISRVMNDVRMLSMLFSQVIKTVVVELPTVIVLLGVAFYRKWDLTALSIVIVPLIGYSTRKIGKRVKQRSKQVQANMAELTQRLSESITAAKVIKVFNKESYRDKKFLDENSRVVRESLKVVRLKESAKLLIDVVTGIAIGLVVWYGGNQVKQGIITPGALASILAAIYLLFTPIKRLGEAYTFLQEIRAAIERIDGVLAMSRESSGTIEVTEFRDSLCFDHVSFAYEADHAPVLKDINLSIKAGEVVAVVGPSGSGKTTFSDLIPRFYSPTAGRITLDGTDLGDIELGSLRSLIGIVSQDIILFNDTVMENIAFGREGATIEDVRKAAEMAYATEFIDKFPEGYNTVVGERGLKLSGGQRQRIAIARAILKNPPILILDEATSSLDTVSEALVQQALEGLMKSRTTIVIAHRLSTIKNADRIVVLEDSVITDIGTHDELLAKGKTYSSLCEGLTL